MGEEIVCRLGAKFSWIFRDMIQQVGRLGKSGGILPQRL